MAAIRTPIALRGALFLLLNCALLSESRAQTISFDGSSSYTQNFDSLPNSGTVTGLSGTGAVDLSAVNLGGTAMTGWYAAKSTGSGSTFSLIADTGSSSAGGLHSYGSTTAPSDRAIGGLASGTIAVRLGGLLMNTSASTTFTQVTITFDAETWRVGQAIPSNETGLAFDYKIASTATIADTTGFTANSTLNATTTFPTPIVTGAQDGNLNKLTVTATITGISWAPGTELAIRWTDSDNSGTDSAVAIDNLTLSAIAATGLTWYGNGLAPGGSGTWDTASNRWYNGATTGSWTPSQLAVFNTSGGSVIVDAGGVSANNGIRFSVDGYVLSGGPITIGSSVNNITVSNVTDTATINSVLLGSNGIVKDGAGKLILGGTNTFLGAVNINGGVLQIGTLDDSALGNAANGIVFGGGTLGITSSVGLGAGRAITNTGSAGFDIAPSTTLTVNGTVQVTSQLTLSNGGTLALNNATTASIKGNISSTNTSGTATITGAIDFGGVARTIDVVDGSASVDLSLTGNLTDTAVYISKTSAGTLQLSGDNTGVGGFQLGVSALAPANGGILQITNNKALGAATSQLRFNDGTLQSTVALTGVNALPYSFSIGGRANGQAVFGGSNNIEVQGGISFFAGAGTSGSIVVVVNNTTTFSGIVSGAVATGIADVHFGGTGNLTLTADSSATLSLPVFVDSSLKVFVNNSTGSGTGTSPVTVNSGATLGGIGTAAGVVTVASGGKIMGGMGIAVGQTLTAGNLTLYNASTIQTVVAAGSGANDATTAGASLIAVANLGRNTSNDLINISLVNDGTLVLDGTTSYTRRALIYSGSLVNLTASGGTGPGGAFVASDGVLSVSGANFAVGSWSAIVASGNVDITFTAAPVPEPSHILAIGAFATGLFLIARRRWRSIGAAV